jgi:small-conductance mechanosensitive channel
MAALDRIEKQLVNAQDATRQALKSYAKELKTIRADAQECVSATDKNITRLGQELAILQPEKPGEAKTEVPQEGMAREPAAASVSPEIARQLKELQGRMSGLDARLATCKLILLRVGELEARTGSFLSDVRNRQLLLRGPNLIEMIRASLEEPKRWLDVTGQVVVKSIGWDVISPVHLGGAAAAGLVGFILGGLVLRGIRNRMGRMKVEGEEEVSVGLVHAVLACGASYAPLILALGSVSAYLGLIPRPDGDLPFIIYLIRGLLAYFIIAAGIRALFKPCPPARHYLALDESITHPLSRRSRILALVALIWWLVQKLQAEVLIDEDMYTLIRHVISLAWVLNLIWVIWLLRSIEGWREKWAVQVLLSLVLLAGLVAGWIGYLNLGGLIIKGITHTLVLLALTVVLGQFFSDLFDGLDAGRYGWQRSVRRAIGLKGEEFLPGLDWLRLVVNLVLWSSAIMLVLYVWGADQITGMILRFFRDGFELAGMTIVPSHLLWAILVLSVLLTVTRWMKGRLNSKWLARTRMEHSAREALVTTFGYVAVAISIILALSIAGIEFTNLAIIAGALSVGIGFGLQNVVNNFISGLIMLVERPVRTGDWIIVGGTEGYVKRISIRTTTIQTFDRAEVIVPNSDLISGQVTNWTLRNQWGRIKVPVGVAYGSDTTLVRDTLLEIVNGHEDFVRGNPNLPDPNVLFIGFGDSSLDFEVRGIVRKIDRRLTVISDINFAIDAAFREKGIEIPFPQRDINFRGPLQVDDGRKN